MEPLAEFVAHVSGPKIIMTLVFLLVLFVIFGRMLPGGWAKHIIFGVVLALVAMPAISLLGGSLGRPVSSDELFVIGAVALGTGAMFGKIKLDD
ncbi:hypothetical protein ACFL5T_01760 [Gemmatimonadota bacterium]